MQTFRQFLYEGISEVKRIKPLPTPDDKEVWDRLRSDLPLTGWLFANGAVSFNNYSGHESNIRRFFRPKEEGRGVRYVGGYLENSGIAIHIEDDPSGGVLEFRVNPKMKPFVLKWAREMGITDKREKIKFSEPYRD